MVSAYISKIIKFHDNPFNTGIVEHCIKNSEIILKALVYLHIFKDSYNVAQRDNLCGI